MANSQNPLLQVAMLYLSISEKYGFTVYTKLISVVLLIFWLPLLLKGTGFLICGG